MQYNCRNTPLNVARQLRQEAGFGCARCGNPIIENAHIIPFKDTKDFPVEDMVALCPNCHTASHSAGWDEEILRKYKSRPFNIGHISEAFIIRNDDLIVNLGGAKFITHLGF